MTRLTREQEQAHDRLDELAKHIKTWDTQDAFELCGYLNEFYSICNDFSIFCNGLNTDEEMTRRRIDVANLPCADVGIDTDWSGIYAVDVRGYVIYTTQTGWEVEEFDPERDYLSA